MEGGRCYYQDDPRRRKNFTLGLCTNFGPCGAQVDKVREGSKNGGRQKQKFNLGPSSCKRPLNLPRVVKLCLPTLSLCISLTVY